MDFPTHPINNSTDSDEIQYGKLPPEVTWQTKFVNIKCGYSSEEASTQSTCKTFRCVHKAHHSRVTVTNSTPTRQQMAA